MGLKIEDISLKMFLSKFTFPNSGETGKIELCMETFLQIASLLRISLDLYQLRVKL